MHGGGEHALGHVAEALRVAQGLSRNRLPMEAAHAKVDLHRQELVTQILVQVTFQEYNTCQIILTNS